MWIPTTLADLARDHAAGEIPAGPERRTAAEDEESEYAALREATDASADLLEEQQTATGRRTVVVAEVPPGADPDGPVPWRHVVAVFADTSNPPRPEEDLGWFATQEVAALLGD